MILYTVRARNDLYEIENYLELLNPAASRRVLATIKSKIENLSTFPGMGMMTTAGVYRLPIVRYPYAVFYETSGDDVVIVHVRHTARAPIDPETDL
jgi:toxin ParE1/3/4